MGEENPMSLTQLAKWCQRIELSLKKVGQNKLTYEHYAAWKTSPMATRSTSAALVTTPTTSAAPASSQFAQVLQSCLLNIITTATNPVTPPAAATSLPRLTEKEQKKLMKFRRCFKYKQEGHTLPDCTQPFKLYSAVSALLQKVILVENNVASVLENK